MLNLVYTCVQILHNFGAVAVVGSPAAAWWFARDNPAAQCRLAWLLAIGWAAQGASGAGFAAKTGSSVRQCTEDPLPIGYSVWSG